MDILSLLQGQGTNPLAALQGLLLGQNQQANMGANFGGQIPVPNPQPSPYAMNQLNNMSGLPPILQQIDAQEPSYNSYGPGQNQFQDAQGGPQLPVQSSGNSTAIIKQQLGAVDPQKPDTVNSILSSRFNTPNSPAMDLSSLPSGTQYGDYANGIIQSALGKPTTGGQLATGRIGDSLKLMETISTLQQAPLKNAYLQSEIDKNNAVSGGLFGMSGSPATQGGATGDTFLAQLPPQIATQVKALAEGRMAFPGGMGMKSPYWQQMLQAVGQYDPNFDALNYQARSKTRQDFTSGKSRQNLTRIDTAINTLGQLADVNDKLGGTDYLNSVRNMALDAQSDPNLVRYNQLAKTAADEVSLAVGGGSSAVGDRMNRLSSFTANQSPKARQAAIETAIQELNSRLDPVASAYNQGMGTSKNGVDLLTPSTIAAYNKIMGVQPEVTNAPGNMNLQNGPDLQDPGFQAFLKSKGVQ